jgi:hypothetical protein
VHGLDAVETKETAASGSDAASLPDRVLAIINNYVVIASSVALVVASLVLTYSVVTRYFLKYSTDRRMSTIKKNPTKMAKKRGASGR